MQVHVASRGINKKNENNESSSCANIFSFALAILSDVHGKRGLCITLTLKT